MGSMKRMREYTYERQIGACWWCGGFLPESFALHHRKLRKHGGPDSLGNLLALCHGCHNLATHAVHLNPQRAYDRGFLVSAYAEPLETPVRIYDGREYLLDDDGMCIGLNERNDNEWGSKYSGSRSPWE
jgi:hypothetical protein